ncbi:conserved exported hypothetical protein [Nostocoides japonicum T1-X7]|uniref:Htaa domain-containing protein n=1 Tax=Nostocoides japonicum T1-X7 TaxID=1194083 RepID=A0A077M832_9MICO|nr:hypothetical protein [Tetrasphaera japonica]CCH80239.1 conserved exported hypothetical protein [Tetrasphaera japonica T1-X7]
MKLTRTGIAAGSLLATALIGSTVATAAYAVADGTTVTIDAAAQPAAAASAMALFPSATDKAFQATTNPAYSETGWEQASTSRLDNPPDSDEDLTQDLKVTHEAEASFSIGGSVGAETTLSALGFANAKVSVKFSAEHQWATQTSDSEKISVTAKPGTSVWIVAAHRQATFTGDYTFTANGTTYHVDNVTITEPAPATGGDATSGVTYLATEQAYTKVNNVTGAAAGSLPKGLVPIGNNPRVQAINAQLPRLKTAG